MYELSYIMKSASRVSEYSELPVNFRFQIHWLVRKTHFGQLELLHGYLLGFTACPRHQFFNLTNKYYIQSNKHMMHITLFFKIL